MKHKAMKLLPIAAALALVSGSVSALEFHGYFRAGSGTNSEDGGLVNFQLPGAYSKYRLGNEPDTYGEAAFDQDLYEGKRDGVKFVYHLMFGYGTTDTRDFVNLGDAGNHFALRQNWVEAKNLPFMGGASVWAGKRYYERNDVHITDFFYWNNSGTGVGVQNIAAGPGKLSYALFHSNDVATQSDAGFRHDFRYGGIPLGGFGDLTVGVQFNTSDSRDPAKQGDGNVVTFQHFMGGVLGGFNKLALQIAKGSASNLANSNPDSTLASGKKGFRLTEVLQVQLNPSISGMATVVYQDRDDEYKWISFGLRPVFHVNEYFKVQVEYGHDEVKPSSGDANNRRKRKLDKFTIAPTIVAGGGFWARPELRLYYTHAKWNAAARDLWGGVVGGTGGPFGQATDGQQFGFQVEAWW
jgi:maltoporin